MWRHSVAVALFSKMIFRREFGERGENIYIAGLLHDIGIIVEDQFLHEDFKKCLRELKEKNKNLPGAEKEVFNLTHSDIGKSITGNCNFPTDLVIAIGYHHNQLSVPDENLKIVMTLHVAECFFQYNGLGPIEYYNS